MANALDKYFGAYSKEIGWFPDPAGPISIDIRGALSGDRNDPSTWFAFAAQTVQTMWGSLPENMRQSAQIALGNLIQLGLQNVGTLAANAAASAGAGLGAVIPLVGAIIEELIAAIAGFIKLAKEIESDKEDAAAGHFMDATRWTVQQYEHPNSWVLKRSGVTNFLDRYDKDWRWRPSFSRSGGVSDRMFAATSGTADKGSCGKGVLLRCGVRSYPALDDCRLQNEDDADRICRRSLMISALFFPFWSPAYPDRTEVPERKTGPPGKLDTTGTGETVYTPVTANSLLIARQMALLTSPSVNLRAGAGRLLKFRDRFVSWYRWSMGEASRVRPIGRNHILEKDAGFLSVDASEKSDLPSLDAPNQFYFDGDGLIQAYRAVDVAQWGVVAKRGPQTPKDVAVSIAQYNTVVSATLAFMSARANFLRNGPMMKVLLLDFDIKTFDSKVRAAMEYSASVGEMLPPPITLTGKRVRPRRAGRARNGGAGVVLAGAAVAAFVALRP